MGSQKYLILHRSEWERIKRERKPGVEPIIVKTHIKCMHELSQEWIKSWPDTTKGHIELLKKIEVKKRNKDIEKIKQFALQKKKDISAEAIQKARQLLFEDSCYGKQLISCLLESKTLEERDAQIEFQKKIKERNVVDEREYISKRNQRKRERENLDMKKLQQKQKEEREISEINKKMYEMQNIERNREKEREKETELEDMKIIKNLLENETKCQIKNKLDNNKQIHEDNVKLCQLKKHLTEKRTREQEKNERINQVWVEYVDRVRRRKNLVYEETKQKDSTKKMHVFHTLEQLKKKQDAKYNDFIDKGIKDLERRILNDDKKYMENQQQKLEDKKLCSLKIKHQMRNKTKEKKQENVQNIPRVCHCDRQTLVYKSSKKCCYDAVDFKNEMPSRPFLPAPLSLVEELKKREKEPSPWNGTKTFHKHFAKQSGKILQECRFKTMARRVIDNYRKNHFLDANNLPIQNYL